MCAHHALQPNRHAVAPGRGGESAPPGGAYLSDSAATLSRGMEDRPTVFVETVRPLEGPQLGVLADALRDAGFEPERSLPREQRSVGAVTFIALRLADAASVLLIERLAVAVRRWVAEQAMPRLREHGVSSVTVPIYGPSGEVLAEVHVADDVTSADSDLTPPARTRA